MPEINLGGSYLKTTDVKSGTRIIFLEPHKTIERTMDGVLKKSDEILVEYEGEKKVLNLNLTKKKILAEAWGTNSDNWVGKQAVLELIPITVKGELKTSILLKPVLNGVQDKSATNSVHAPTPSGFGEIDGKPVDVLKVNVGG